MLNADLAILVAGALVAIVAWIGWHQRRGTWWTVLRVALMVYVAVIVANAFFPFPLPPWEIPPEFTEVSTLWPWPWPWANIVPLATISDGIGLGFGWQPARYLLANVLAFAPIGVFVGLFRPEDHGWRMAIAVGFAVSLGIEGAQLVLSLLIGWTYRVFDVDDLLLNSVGVALGYGAFVVVDGVARAVLPARLVFWGGGRVPSPP